MINNLFYIGEILDLIWTVIILILLVVIIIGSIYLITYKYLRNILFRLRKRHEKPWYSSEIPELLLKSIESTESILFKSVKIKHRKKVRLIQIIVLLGVFGFLGALDLLFFSLGLDLFVFSLLIGVVIAPFSMRSFSQDYKKDSYFLFTDKKFHLYIYSYKSKLPHIDKYDYNSFIGVIFRKKFYDKNGDFGTVNFITNHSIPRKISIRNVPDFVRMQILIKSILYEYGNVKNNWGDFTNQLHINFPREYEISEKKLKSNMKSIRGYLITILVMIIVSVIFYYILDVIFITEIWHFWLTFAGIFIFNVIMDIVFLRDIILMKVRS